MKWKCNRCLLPCFLNVEDKEVISEPIRCPWNENAAWKLVEEPNSTGTSKPVDGWLELPRMVTENGLNSEHVMYNAAIEQIRQRIEKLEKAGE